MKSPRVPGSVGGSPLRTILVALLVLAFVAPLAPTAPAAAPTATHTVAAHDFFWSPASLSAAAGDSVTFTLEEGFHNWVSDAGLGSCSLPCTIAFPDEGSFPYHCGIHPSMTGVVTVGAPPVVAFTSPADGATVEGTVRLAGTATHATSDIARVQLAVDAGPFREATRDSLGGDITWHLDVDTTTLANGAHTLVARATTASGATGEATMAITVANPVAVDLRITALTPIDGYPATRIHFVVHNAGNSASGAYIATAEYSYEGAWRPIASVQMPSLAAGASASRTVTWDGGGLLVGAFDVRVIADADERVVETDETNNVRTGEVAFLTDAVDGMDLRAP